MGVVNNLDAASGLTGSLRFFREHLKMLLSPNSIGIFEAYGCILILGMYLYSRYYTCGFKRGDAYDINQSVLYGLYVDYDEPMADYVETIIKVRNKVGHALYNTSTDKAVMSVLRDERLKLLLRYEGIISSDEALGAATFKMQV